MQHRRDEAGNCSLEKDINDAFDEILLSEEHLVKNSYKEGYRIGQAEGNLEAFHLGYHRGAETGAEIGYYSYLTDKYLENNQPEKVLKILLTLKTSLDSFPKENNPDIDILQEISNIRAQFKKLSALLKIDFVYPKTDNLSF